MAQPHTCRLGHQWESDGPDAEVCPVCVSTGVSWNLSGSSTVEGGVRSLSDGPLRVFDANGSAIVVHANPDQGITGAAGSGVSGGVRVACGIIIPE